MSKLSTVCIREFVLKELRQMFRDPRMKPLVFVSPIIQLLLFGYAVNTDVRNTAMIVADFDQTQESRLLIDGFTASGYFEKVKDTNRPEDIRRSLEDGTAVIAITIPRNFSTDLKSGQNPSVQILVDGSQSNTATVAQGYAVRMIQAFSARQLGGRSGPIDVRTRAWYNPSLESRVYNVPAIIGVLLLLMCLLLTSLSVVREREIGTLDQLMVSPLKPAELMLGKTIPVAIVAFIDLALITSLAVLWFDIPLRGSHTALLVAAGLYIVAGLSAGLLLSTVANTQQEAFMTMFLFLLPTIILSGFFFPIESMPLPFQWLSFFNPVRHFLEIVRGIFLKGTGPVDLWPQYLFMATIALAAFTLATKRFERSLS